jgi:hypothetical protein
MGFAVTVPGSMGQTGITPVLFYGLRWKYGKKQQNEQKQASLLDRRFCPAAKPGLNSCPALVRTQPAPDSSNDPAVFS